MYKINGLIAISMLGLVACGGGSGGGSSSVVVNNGVFKDSNVSGLAYESGGQKGITDLKGGFKFEEGADVSFNIGGVSLGSGKGKSVMTPLDLVDGGQLMTPEVINKVRFLMMLDKDNMPSNGIEISAKVQEKAKSWILVDFAAVGFPTQDVNRIVTEASVADAVVHELPAADAATAHLKTTLLCANAGAYVGSYAGTGEGNIALTVNPITGEVNGSSYNSTNQVSVEIKNTTALDYDMDLEFIGSEDSGKVFSGKLNSTEEISGSWENSNDEADKGTFLADRLGGVSNAVYRYTVAYIGSDKGLITLDVDSANKVTGTIYSVSTKKESAIKTGSLLDNTLTAKTVDGTNINGDLDADTLSLSGVWSNVSALKAGTYTGGGCRLN